MSTSRSFLLTSFVLTAFGLAACSTPPAPPPPAKAPVAPAPERVRVVPVLAPGVTVSAPQTGDTTVAFQQSSLGERTFPSNRIGASLAFTSNLRMPKLEAVEISADGFQLRMRFRNAVNEPLFVSMVCSLDGEKSARAVIRSLEFPVNTFRDITMELTGDPRQKISIRASAVPVSSQLPEN